MVVCDVSEHAVARVRERHPEVEVVADNDALIHSGLDVYAPCALGGSLNDATVPELTARIVCGAANNQLAHTGIEKQLADRGVLYAPDYTVNSGGVIQVADEIDGFDFDRARARASGIFETTRRIFALAADEGVPLRSRRTASPSGGCPRSAACAESCSSRMSTAPGRPAARSPAHAPPGHVSMQLH